MKIMKYKKSKQNTYIVTIDMHDYTLYDDIIIKYELLLRKNIKEEFLNKILKENKALESYYTSLKYLSKGEKCQFEIESYLQKKGFSNEEIKEAIKRLQKDGYLNEEKYVSYYIHDALEFSYDGPSKIKQKLIRLNINKDLIDEKILEIPSEVWQSKIKKIIDKKIKTNKTLSKEILKQKLANYLYSNGYFKEQFSSLIEEIDLTNDPEILLKEVAKQKRILARKFSGKELEYRLKMKLISKGYKESEIEGVL